MKINSLIIDISTQTLTLYTQRQAVAQYRVSTAAKGAGEESGSLMTPRGKHMIRAKIGADLPEGAVLVGRRFTGEVYSPILAAKFPARDWILSRILWLSGTQPGVNRGGHVDTLRRYIYIHGCPDSAPMGVPHSIGCIRMRNQDVVTLFDQVAVGMDVVIVEDSSRLSDQSIPVIRELNAQQAMHLPLISGGRCYTTETTTMLSEGAYFYAVWDQCGEVIASARLRLEGVLDTLFLQNITLLQPLLSRVRVRANQLGWLEIRTMACVENTAAFQACQFEPVGDAFEDNGQRYQQCRAFIRK